MRVCVQKSLSVRAIVTLMVNDDGNLSVRLDKLFEQAFEWDKFDFRSQFHSCSAVLQ
jgi:hypothetical protein